MHLKLHGLVLRVVNYRDNDVILTILTGEHGKISAKARGVRRKNSPLIAACQLLTYSEFTLFENRGMFSVNEATPVALFHGLRNDLGKLSLGSYFAQVSELLSQEDMPSPELLALTLNCLYLLSQGGVTEPKAKAVFELRAVCLAGYTPDLTGCHSCQEPYPDMLDLSQGLLECSRCRVDGSGIRMPVDPGVLEAMRYICTCEPKRLFAFSLSDAGLQKLAQITESYLTTQLERSFSTLDFYKSLQLPFCT